MACSRNAAMNFKVSILHSPLGRSAVQGMVACSSAASLLKTSFSCWSSTSMLGIAPSLLSLLDKWVEMGSMGIGRGKSAEPTGQQVNRDSKVNRVNKGASGFRGQSSSDQAVSRLGNRKDSMKTCLGKDWMSRRRLEGSSQLVDCVLVCEKKTS